MNYFDFPETSRADDTDTLPTPEREAGLSRVLDAIDALPAAAWFVTRDGKPVSPLLPSENHAFTWLLSHQGMSTDWAMKHEGYAVVSLPLD